MKLFNKVAIITGAGSGIGRASAIMFAKEGAKIIVADINDGGGEDTVTAIKSSGGEAAFVHTDVSLAYEVESLIKVAKNKFGKIDILFNNAGVVHELTPVENLDESLFDRVYAVNVKAHFMTAKYVVPVMREAGGGVIINMASMAGIRPRKGQSAYASSKAAVIGLTKALALELAPHRIRANCICPAAVDTPLAPQMVPKGISVEEFNEAIIQTMPLGRIATPEDVGYAALYLASDESAMLTGSCINVDGGRGI